MAEDQPLLTNDNQYRQYSARTARRPPSAILIENHETPKWKIRTSCVVILLVETCERIAFYSLIGNFVLFLKDSPFVWSNIHATLVSFIFLGVSFITSLFGGLLADAALGRFKTLVLAFLLYGLGYSLLTILSFGKFPCSFEKEIININTTIVPVTTPSGISDENCLITVFLVVCTIALGGGIFRANIAPFGADQEQPETLIAAFGFLPRHLATPFMTRIWIRILLIVNTKRLRDTNPLKVRSFFNLFYMCLNIGAIIGLGGISYVQQQFGFHYGYIGAMGSLAFGFILFLCGRCLYKISPPNGSVLINICRITKDAFRSKKEHRRRTSLTNFQRQYDNSGSLYYEPSFLDWAKIRHGGHFHDSLVDDVKSLGKVIIFFLFFVPYWIVYFQIETTFLLQGLHMKLDPFKVSNFTAQPNIYNCSRIATVKSPQISISWLSLFNVLVILVSIPLMEKIILPWLDKNGRPISLQQRILIGMLCAMLAMIAAGLVEFQRLKSIFYDRNNSCDCTMIQQILNKNNIYYAADLTIFWQIPQYVLLGLSEVFTIVAGLEFAYSMAPKSMKGIIMGLFQFFTGVGSLLGPPVIEIFKESFFLKDINKSQCKNGHIISTAHLDYYFYIMAAVLAFFIIVFMIVAHCLNFNYSTSIYESRDPCNGDVPQKTPKVNRSR